MMSKRDVIISRGIWYMMTLVSLLALAISINLLWPKHDPSKSRFFKHCAVSATTFYAVMLFRYFFFAEPVSHVSTLMKKFPDLMNSPLISRLGRRSQNLILP
ncbi:hypothetical protein F2Q68_00002693 [Brassica cretica]|nr:hypothetical protein F2Q68_00002693 [Brassica cretica]